MHRPTTDQLLTGTAAAFFVAGADLAIFPAAVLMSRNEGAALAYTGFVASPLSPLLVGTSGSTLKLGILSLLIAALCIAVGMGILRRETWARLLGTLLAAGAAAGWMITGLRVLGSDLTMATWSIGGAAIATAVACTLSARTIREKFDATGLLSRGQKATIVATALSGFLAAGWVFSAVGPSKISKPTLRHSVRFGKKRP